MSHYGIQTSSWLRIEGECPIRYQTCGCDAEFSLGGRDHDVNIVASEEGLHALIEAATSALKDLQAQPSDA